MIRIAFISSRGPTPATFGAARGLRARLRESVKVAISVLAPRAGGRDHLTRIRATSRLARSVVATKRRPVVRDYDWFALAVPLEATTAVVLAYLNCFVAVTAQQARWGV